MTRPSIVVVSGLPASGKTTLARWLAAELRLPLAGRDDIKERLFDSLGWSDREWSQRLGGASWDLLHWFVEMQLSAGKSCIVESNFDPVRDCDWISAYVDRFGARLIEVHCHADGSVLVERYLGRVRSGERHPGHVDDVTIDEKREQLLGARPRPLAIDGTTLVIDTTDPASIDYDWIVAELRTVMTEDG